MSIQDKQAVFVCGVPKSGTTLFMSLLDGHKELLVFPEQCAYLRFPINGQIQEDDILKSLFKEKKLPRFKNVEIAADRINKEKKDYSSINYADLSKSATDFYFESLGRLSSEGFSTPKIALLALLHGFSSAAGIASFDKWVLKQPKYEFHINEIFSDFPNALIIFMLRNPVESALSRTIKSEKKNRFEGESGDIPRVDSENLKINALFLEEWKRSVSAISKACREYPSRVLVVRYEDLTENPETLMRELADFLGITWSKCLLEPTFMGSQWRGNSMQEKKFSGIQKNEPRTLPHHIQWQVESILGQSLAEWGYEFKTLNKRVDIQGIFSFLPGESFTSAIRYRAKRLLNL